MKEITMKGKELLQKFLKEKDKNNKRRVIKYSSTFNMWGFSNKKVFEEMMEWAFNKGEESGREIGYSQCSYDNTGERSMI